MNDWCFGMIGPAYWRSTPGQSINPWAAYFPHLPADGSVEWFVHPGEADESLAGRDTYIRQRPMELKALIEMARLPEWETWAAAMMTKTGARTI